MNNNSHFLTLQKMKLTNNYQAFKLLLILFSLSIIIYTYFTIQIDGFNFFGYAQEYLFSLKWKGQFTLDFFSYLTLSGIWIMWRSRFSAQSVVAGITAMIFGIMFFAPYLLFQINKENGDLNKVLLGGRI
ncbi:MAG: hypothetical protein BalsKO_22810 [Balneolaceae bacterium]